LVLTRRRKVGAGELAAGLHALVHVRPERLRMVEMRAVIRRRVARDDRALRREQEIAEWQAAFLDLRAERGERAPGLAGRALDLRIEIYEEVIRRHEDA